MTAVIATRVARRWTGLVLLLGAACHKGQAEGEAEAEVKPIVTVKVATAAAAEIDLAVRAPATIFPRERVSISSNLTVPIRTLHARKGDKVAKNQLLAQLEDRDLIAQKGEAVAALRQADVLRTRRAELFAQGAIPQRELLATETELAQSRARLEKIEATLRFTELRSPFSGVIVEQQLYAGDVIRPDTPVFTVVDMRIAIARAQVPESDIGGVALGQKASFTSNDGQGTSWPGRISMISQAVDPARRTVEVWSEIDNKEGALRDGTFGQLAIATTTRAKRVLVPRAAVLLEGDERAGSVMVVSGDKDKPTAHKRAVVTAEGPDPQQMAVSKGLQAGEVVVVEGGYGLPDGTSVRIAPAAEEPGTK